MKKESKPYEIKKINMNLKVSDHTSRVLGVIKEKYGLKDKAKALDWFADRYGEEFVEKEVKDEVIREMIKSTEAHIKKHGFKSTAIEELEKEFEQEEWCLDMDFQIV